MLQLILYWVHFVLVLIALLSVLNSRKSPASSIAWILAVTVIPVGGLITFALFGIDRKKRRVIPRIPEEVLADYLADSPARRPDPKGSPPDTADRMVALLARSASAPLTLGNTLRTYFSGADKFHDLTADLQAAEESIHMEYYLWRSDTLGRRIREILEERARRGVKVRLIFDGVGSFAKISYAYRRSLKEAGIEFAYFLDLSSPIARLKINYRNHRKIVVIDGRTGYTGGMNIGSEYIDGGTRFESWRDTHLRIEGPGVSMLQAVFLADWYSSGGHPLPPDEILPEPEFPAPPGGIPMQIAISGPDSPWDGVRLHYLELLGGARTEILIQTPYFIPGEAVEKAIIAAALRGVRVIIITVGKPDYRIPYWAAQTYFEPLLRAGVEIYRYQAGFIHSKVFIQDRIVASVGTCNVDIRSFELDYEINAVIYSPEEAALHAEQFHRDLRHCRRVSLNDVRTGPFLGRLRNSIFRLLSPLM